MTFGVTFVTFPSFLSLPAYFPEFPESPGMVDRTHHWWHSGDTMATIKTASNAAYSTSVDTMNLRKFLRGGYKHVAPNTLIVNSKGDTVLTVSPGVRVMTPTDEMPDWLKE